MSASQGAGHDRGCFAVALERADLDLALLDQWVVLEARAVEPNVYLSPHFVLPALDHFPEHGEPLFVAVFEGTLHARTLRGLGLFVRCGPNLHFPLPHLSAYRCSHSFRTGLLVDRGVADEVAHAFFEFFCQPAASWYGVSFEDTSANGPLQQMLLGAADRFGARWQCFEQQTRAVLRLDADAGAARRALGTRQLRDYLRKERRMLEQADVTWSLRRGTDVDETTMDTHLRLEDMGWKGRAVSSLRGRPAHERFFLDVTRRFAREDRAFFTELRIAGRVVASTSNFISQDMGFAFKIGWDADLASLSPGVLNEIQFLRHGAQYLPELACIDSGACEGSFIDKLWLDRMVLQAGVFVTCPAGAVVNSVWDTMRRARRRVLRIFARDGGRGD